ncbi:MAG: hypothetical protein COT81_04745 [Candidatus Buchananbacteria bacterium CG10_big_fil_rev_8_21_14_0_10_42_9]|uniref:4'-phosphopantetheinyl transferase domain-containing protein n=1 Tax=Candidatus Buchananbacteria bacterium CG10_big_fil_rev_8_21_14_0_10_42_9 TaxID=1974526 RepID=A0A2H0W065_9BACT|nr:MAG: hypothetical protein COT81_04745 [Candidatus Buchananbacteria bacterium CG10_big_fil_rev_8_21_14_0_10_42_9]
MQLTITGNRLTDGWAEDLDWILSHEEKLIFNQVKNFQQQDWLAGRIALKQAVLRHVDAKNLNQLVIRNYASGQPYLEGYEYLNCSLSHSFGWAIASAGKQIVGVDIEKIRPHADDLVYAIAGNAEVRLMNNVNKNLNVKLTYIWTIKESVMKGLGIGFGISPKNLYIKKINIKKNNFQSLIFNSQSKDYWTVFSTAMDEFIMSLAQKGTSHVKAKINWN